MRVSMEKAHTPKIAPHTTHAAPAQPTHASRAGKGHTDYADPIPAKQTAGRLAFPSKGKEWSWSKK